jgi:hypothetical protein
MTEAEIAAYNRGIEDAAMIAQPPLKARAKPGMWFLRRKKIADDIRACKVETSAAKRLGRNDG